MKRRINSFSIDGYRSQSQIAILLILFVICAVAGARSWPTYRADTARSGTTSETVGPKLFLQWKYTPAHPPKPAWPMPGEELPRMHNDNAYHVVITDV